MKRNRTPGSASQLLLGSLPRKGAKVYPERTAVVYRDKRLTYRELNEKVLRLANGLVSLDVKKGDRVAILQHNSHHYVEAYFAITLIGAIAVPINFRFVGREIAYILKDAEAETIIVGDTYLETLASIRTNLPLLKNIICIGSSQDNMVEYKDLLGNSPIKEIERRLNDDDVVFLMYTAGTTGKPKGAMLTHRNLLSSTTALAICRKLGPEDVLLLSAPIFHIASATGIIATIFSRATNVVLDRFDPNLLLETIEKEKATIVGIVPAMLIQIINSPELFNRYDLKSVRAISYGASPMPSDVIKKALEMFQCEFMQGYGMTEISAAYVTFLEPSDHRIDGNHRSERILSSVGKEAINAEMRIVDDQDRDLPRGEVGEIIVRGQHVMKGYWRMPEASEEALRGGWFHTGDLGKMDDEGYLYLVDRKKDMIISGGENIYSKEVEDILFSHPSVLEAAVIGVPDEKWGETVKAVVVLKAGMKVTEEGLIEFCKRHLASYKKPTSVEFIDALPRNAAGKVVKRILKEEYKPIGK